MLSSAYCDYATLFNFYFSLIIAVKNNKPKIFYLTSLEFFDFEVPILFVFKKS